MTTAELSSSLSAAINDNLEFLKNLQDPAKQPLPDKWSAKQIIGHLIDSANNNHRRFVKAQYQDNLIFTGYDQEEWVEVQNYHQTDWLALLEMWKVYNLFICEVINNIDEQKLNFKTIEHNYFDIGWGTSKAKCQLKPGDSSDLAFLIEDYIGHLKHHLEQIRSMV